MIGEKLYRVFHDNSVSPFIRGRGFAAGDTFNPFDPRDRHVAKAVVQRHCNGYNRNPTPLISVFDSFEKAWEQAHTTSTNTNYRIKIAIIQYSRLRDDYGIQVFRFTDLIKMTNAEVSLADRGAHAHCVCVHFIPTGAITEICTLDEFERHSTYNRELPIFSEQLAILFSCDTVGALGNTLPQTNQLRSTPRGGLRVARGRATTRGRAAASSSRELLVLFACFHGLIQWWHSRAWQGVAPNASTTAHHKGRLEFL